MNHIPLRNENFSKSLASIGHLVKNKKNKLVLIDFE
jgi:hypothetical protein